MMPTLTQLYYPVQGVDLDFSCLHRTKVVQVLGFLVWVCTLRLVTNVTKISNVPFLKFAQAGGNLGSFGICFF